MVAGSGSTPDVDRLAEASRFPKLPALRRRRPRISVQDVELDRTPHAGAGDLAIPAGGRRRKLLSLYSTAKLCVDPGKHVSAERDQRSHRLVQPLLIRVFVVESDVGPQRRGEVSPNPGGGVDGSARADEWKEPGQCLDRRDASPRLPLRPLLVHPPAGPAMELRFGRWRGPRQRLGSLDVERLAQPFRESSSLRNASASDLVRNALPRERPSTAHRTIQGLVAFSSLRRSCTPQMRTSCHDEICGGTMGRE